MTTVTGSSASRSVAKRLRPELPLIICGKCKQKIVMEYRVKRQGPNKGRVFYKCPDRDWEGNGCDGWYWEEDYATYVQNLGALEVADAADEAIMSRHWMYNADRRSQDFIEGLHYFLGVAEANKRDGFICCPCALCKNLKEYSSSMSLHSHLLKSGFMSNYICWTKHGESGVMMEEGEGEDLDIDDIIAQYGAFDDTTMGGDEEEVAVEDDLGDALGDAIRDAQQEWESEKEKVKLERMLEDHRKLLYPMAEEGQKKLGTTLELLQWKAKNGVSDKAFGNLLNLIKKMLPKPNELPTTTYEAKKVVCPLGLKIQKIHACPNDCILYHGNEYENLDECPVCKASRYKIRRDDPGDVEGEQRPRKKIPAKVMWYAPIIPRLKRLFRNKDHAKLLRWYKEDRKVDNMLRHPADGSQWRAIDREFSEFANEVRNLRFALSTDGMNPFGQQSTSPRQPGNDIDVYLKPLVEELLVLWNKPGVRVWDEYKQEHFDLRAMLFVTINDWPALSNLSGQTNKGYNACTHCFDDLDSIYLKRCRKVVYLGHRRFLPLNHQVRKKGKHFKGKPDHRKKPHNRTGEDVLAMVKDVKVVFGKGQGSESVPKDANGHAPMWKKKSIFWELPYWQVLETGDGRHYLSPASYTLSKEERDSMFECLSSIKVPSGFSSNIKGIINVPDKKFLNLKSHDCHVLMTQLLPVALRGILPPHVRLATVKLCAFLNAISQKAINPVELATLQNDVVQCLVSFELVFPPSFFNIMTHILVHLVKEISILGPVFLHNMFPFERFMGVLKKYVKVRSKPEGSIAQGYGTEEVIEFCVDFIPDIAPIGVPESRHEGRLSGKGTLGKKTYIGMEDDYFNKAHYTVLQNSSLVHPYIEIHKEFLRSKQPSWHILTYQGYEINGNTFYTVAQDKRSTNQNSGVRIDGTDPNGNIQTYYGRIEEIWELDYAPNFKVPLFRCQWVKLTGGGVTVDKEYGMTTVDLNNIGYKEEPFVLAADVSQVFYVKDMSTKSKRGKNEDINSMINEPKRHIILSGKINIVGIEDKSDMSEDYERNVRIPPFIVKKDPSIMLNDEDTPWLRQDHNQGSYVKKKFTVVPA
ncbi:uncharacterized protein [Miscanthus floridulus]|uniref:uncharacterized protein n=1 Tax=Miscanthus floridulus TaxID=154761 RepID=UPI00345AC616